MRLEMAERICRTANIMMARPDGASLDDIQQTFEISRSTAERIRNSVERLYPDITVRTDMERKKRWRIPNTIKNRYICFTSTELAALYFAEHCLIKNNCPTEADCLRNMISKIEVLIEPTKKRSLETDAQALIESAAFCNKARWTNRINEKAYGEVINAILASKRIKLDYHATYTPDKPTLVEPYGLLYGPRLYLVGYAPEWEECLLYTFSNINAVEIRDEYFVKAEGFDLQNFVDQSFGVFHEQPSEIELEADAAIAADIRRYVFHPQQTISEKADGSLTICFKSGGYTEIVWELFRWGRHLQIRGPRELKDRYREQLAEAQKSLDD